MLVFSFLFGLFGLGVERGLVVETVKDTTEKGGPAEDLYPKKSDVRS